MVLTFQEYQKQHKQKLIGLNPGQRAAKYREYLASVQRATGAKVVKKPKGAPKSKAVGKAIAETAASFLPPMFKPLAPLAGSLGGMLGEGIGTLLGLGEYKVKENSFISEGNPVPYMHGSGATTVVRHREYLGDIFSSATDGAFEKTEFKIQPGIASTFPWFSTVAANYQEWKPRGMVFEFVSQTGLISSAATPQVGMVIMATDYDSFQAEPFTNKVDMENTQYTTSRKATESFMHPIECATNANVMNRLFVRAGALPDNQPPQLYDLGTFVVASIGCPTVSQNLGELWVTFEIELSKPTLRNNHTSSIECDLFNAQPIPSASNSMFSGSGAVVTAGTSNSIGGSIDSGGTYFFPPTYGSGQYLVVATYEQTTGTSWGVLGNYLLAMTNCINVTDQLDNPTGGLGPDGEFLNPTGPAPLYGQVFVGPLQGGFASNEKIMYFLLELTATGASVKVDPLGQLTSIGSCNLMVLKWNKNNGFPLPMAGKRLKQGKTAPSEERQMAMQRSKTLIGGHPLKLTPAPPVVPTKTHVKRLRVTEVSDKVEDVPSTAGTSVGETAVAAGENLGQILEIQRQLASLIEKTPTAS